MELSSVAIPDGSVILPRYAEPGAGGDNVSPDLRWSGAPDGTRSFAVTCFDPDAPTGSGWWHWVAIDLPASVTGLAEGEALPGREWVNDYGYVGYGGPCPPPGPAHRYEFAVHALDVAELGVPDEATSAAVRFTVHAHTLDRATFTATFAVD